MWIWIRKITSIKQLSSCFSSFVGNVSSYSKSICRQKWLPAVSSMRGIMFSVNRNGKCKEWKCIFALITSSFPTSPWWKVTNRLKAYSRPKLFFLFFSCCRSMIFGYSGGKSMLTWLYGPDCMDHYIFSNHKELYLYLKTALLHLISPLSRPGASTFRLAGHIDF